MSLATGRDWEQTHFNITDDHPILEYINKVIITYPPLRGHVWIMLTKEANNFQYFTCINKVIYYLEEIMNECTSSENGKWRRNKSLSLTIHHGQVSKVSANLPPAASKRTLVQKCT